MSDLRTAAQQALNALVLMRDRYEEYACPACDHADAATYALRAALEKPERAQAMRDAGYTRRPTLREMAEGEQPEHGCAECGVTSTPDSMTALYCVQCISKMEQPEQEPVAWEQIGLPSGRTTAAKGWLFSEPPRREWKGLKEWEINDGLDQLPTEDVCSWSFRKGVYFAEAALKERNA